jgi:hypothetical protein
VAKFFPWWDGPYRITDIHPEVSTYTLDIATNAYPVYHASKLKKYLANNDILFPSHALSQPKPVMTSDGLEEYMVKRISDLCHRGCSWQFLVHWQGYGQEHDLWIPTSELDKCEALDRWYLDGGDGLDAR